MIKPGDILIRLFKHGIPSIIEILEIPGNYFSIYRVKRLTNTIVGKYIGPHSIKKYKKINDLERILYL